MMRQLFILIVLGAAGYLGYLASIGKLPTKLEIPWARINSSTSDAASNPDSTPVPSAAELQAQRDAAVAATFRSKIAGPESAEPGQKRLAPPAVFYVLERLSTETPSGIHAVVPGDQVKLLKRLGNGSMKVIAGEVEFIVRENQVTNDLDVARAAELKDHSVYRARR